MSLEFRRVSERVEALKQDLAKMEESVTSSTEEVVKLRSELDARIEEFRAELNASVKATVDAAIEKATSDLKAFVKTVTPTAGSKPAPKSSE